MSGSFAAISSVASKTAKMRSMSSASAPTISANHVFEIPVKLIKTPADMKIWEKSEAYFEYLGFILAINEAVRGKSNMQGSENMSESINKMSAVLDKLDSLIDETPPVQQPQRFGNVAFRTWYQKMKEESLGLLQQVIRPELNKAIPEVATYLVDSFGNSTRIDYGTGHEISFVMFLCCLFKIGILNEFDKVAAGCYIFPKYLDLSRKLQKTYRIEPAGSHGVWSLDDYQFVPFIWGSSQLVGHSVIEPQLFLNQQLLNEYGGDYMFLTCIRYINSVKTGPFAEHSNQLWSISGVSSWSKINGGLIKMYKAEVLSKFPVVQHIVFGSLFALKPMEQCYGMMTPKHEMAPRPKAGSITTESTESTEAASSGGSSAFTPSFHPPSTPPTLSGSRESSVASGQTHSTFRSRESSRKSERSTAKQSVASSVRSSVSKLPSWESHRDSEAQSRRESETQSHRDSEAQSRRGSETQSHRESEAQSRRGSETQSRRDIESTTTVEAVLGEERASEGFTPIDREPTDSVRFEEADDTSSKKNIKVNPEVSAGK